MKEDYLKTIEELRNKMILDNKNINWIELVDILEYLEQVEKILKK